MTQAPRAAFFVMPQAGHFHRLRPLISGLMTRGIEPYVFTDRRFKADVERAGGTFVDLFTKYPLDRADSASVPFPCRFVSFAGCYAEEILRDLEKLRPALVVYDTFALIGRVVGAHLGIPYVNVCAGHNVDPARIPELLRTVPRIDIAPECHRAVEKLREHYGLRDASPFSFISEPSPFLNVYCEPREFLSEAARRAFDPLALHGSLPPIDEIEARPQVEGVSHFATDSSRLKVYVSFGTVVWRYWPAQALDAMRSISNFFAGTSDVRVLISLGGTAELDEQSVRTLRNRSVSVESYVDQWTVLEQADLFVTHHGLNSTHEAIFNRVPMISYPFLWDQLALAAQCRRFGLAITLARSPRSPVRAKDIQDTIAQFDQRREAMTARLHEARRWELEVLGNRDSVLEQITGLISA